MTSVEFRKMFIKDIIFVGCFVAVFLFLFQPTIVRQTSMYPTFNDGDYLIVFRQAYRFDDVKRGDVVVFESDEFEEGDRLLIKRVIGLPGDTLKIDDFVLYVNGEPIKEPYIKENVEYMDEVTIDEGEYYCMGDNRPSSLDSRELGAIDKDKFVGKVIVRLYPFDKVGTKF